MRRNLEIDFDITVAVDNDILYIYTDGSRPTRPLLIVGENGVPLITERNMWNSDFKTLLKGGVVEYVDPCEIHLHNVIAPSVEKIILVSEDLNLNSRLLDRSKQEMAELTKILIINSRPDYATNDIVEKKRKEIRNREHPIISNDPLEKWINASSNVMRVKEKIGAFKLTRERLLRKKYTHVEMDPTSVFGVSASAIPHISNNPGPRNNFQCSMFKQAIGMNTSNPAGSYSKTDKNLASPARPLSGTHMQRLLGLDSLPAGNNIILAVMTTSTNEEDAITVKKEALERGLFTYTVLHSYNVVLKNMAGVSRTGVGIVTKDFLVKPIKPFPRHTASNYEGLNNRGIAEVDKLMIPGDCLVGITRVIMEKNGSFETSEYEDMSIYLNAYEEGIVDSVIVAKTPEKEL